MFELDVKGLKSVSKESQTNIVVHLLQIASHQMSFAFLICPATYGLHTWLSNAFPPDADLAPKNNAVTVAQCLSLSGVVGLDMELGEDMYHENYWHDDPDKAPLLIAFSPSSHKEANLRPACVRLCRSLGWYSVDNTSNRVTRVFQKAEAFQSSSGFFAASFTVKAEMRPEIIQ
jgi:hypothetical protein